MDTLEQRWQGYQRAKRLHEVSEIQRADQRAALADIRVLDQAVGDNHGTGC